MPAPAPCPARPSIRWLLATLLAGGCVSPPSAQPLEVLAASSLGAAFNALAAQAPPPGVRVATAGSQVLALQLGQGAPADVIATADEETMAGLVASGLVRAPVVFAENEPVLVVAAGVPVTGLSTLPLARRIVLAAPAVPLGRYTRRLLELTEGDAALGPDFRARVERQVVSYEPNVQQVMARLELGEVDAAIAYRSSVLPDAGAALRVVRFPPGYRLTARYPVAVVASSRRPVEAQAFVALLRSPEGQAVLQRFGLSPSGTTP